MPCCQERLVQTDLCSSSSSSLDIIISRWWERDFPGRYLKEPSSLAVAVSEGDRMYNMIQRPPKKTFTDIIAKLFRWNQTQVLLQSQYWYIIIQQRILLKVTHKLLIHSEIKITTMNQLSHNNILWWTFCPDCFASQTQLHCGLSGFWKIKSNLRSSPSGSSGLSVAPSAWRWENAHFRSSLSESPIKDLRLRPDEASDDESTSG